MHTKISIDVETNVLKTSVYWCMLTSLIARLKFLLS